MSGLIDFLVAHWLLSLLFITLLLCYLGFEIFYSQNSKQISPIMAVDLLNHQQAVIIDIRSKEAYEQGHIINAINIPQEQLMAEPKKVQRYKNNPIILVCAVGKDSAKVIAKLSELNFSKVLQVSGGMQEWVASGFPLVAGKTS